LAATAENGQPPQIFIYDKVAGILSQQGIRNVGGLMLLTIIAPNCDKNREQVYLTKIYSELLAIYLHNRLGEELALNDPYTGKPYVRGADGVPFSVGPDGKPGTKDDITLRY